MTCNTPLRVVLIGAESTGKTTLCIELARHYSTVWIAEYGRELWEEKLAAQSLKGGDIPEWTDEDFIHIAEEQQRRENEAAKRANRVLICDTNAFATATWYERYAGKRHTAVDAIGNADKVDLYLIPTPEVPFVQDGVRDGEKIRGWMHDRFVELIEQAGVPYTLITGPWEGRVDQAIAAIDALLARCESAPTA
ncbi:AAA family ATPase [Hyphomonas sp. NPDC076900]|uniref:AAA family ATPase n=1 Tax=unclassified Hyphomonas TaxID=2630699 RepID=UPI003CFE621D